MNSLKTVRKNCWKSILAVLVSLSAVFPSTASEQEVSFPVLTIGTQSYTNATITTRNKDYVFLMHAGGLVNLKLANLAPEDRAKLGLAPASQADKQGWTRKVLAKNPVKEVQEIKSDLSTIAQDSGFTLPAVAPSRNLILAVCGILLFMFLFWSYCSALICQKTGNPGGVLVWIPVLQLIPMLRAAGMSVWWSLAFLVPILNLVAQIIWTIRIVEARGKGLLCTIFMFLPVTNLFAYLYLAFSEAADGVETTDRSKENLMSLEAA